MFSKLRYFFNEYKSLGFVLSAAFIGLLLDLSGYDRAAHILFGATSLSMVLPMLRDMIQTLKEGRYGVDILAATAIITSVLLGEYWSGMIIVLMLTGGEALEDYAENRAKKELTSLLDRAPQKATVIRGDKEIELPVSEVKVGDKLLIKSGEVLPVDGVIVKGSTSVDESSLTGESMPVVKTKNDNVMSGSVNTEGSFVMEASQTSENSQYEQIIQLVKSAADSEAPFVKLTDRYSIPFTIASFIIAGLMWVITKDPNRFLQILVVATPCPLLLAAPIALISGMSRSAKYGIIVKNGSVLEKLASLHSFGFDKTGTLTTGQPEVKNIVVINAKLAENELLAIAASLESQSSHVLARTIVDAAENKSVKKVKTGPIKEVSGHGIESTYKGTAVRIGNARFMEQLSIKLPKNVIAEVHGKTASFISLGDSLAGYIVFEDAVRPDARYTVDALHSLGIKEAIMVTGDKQSVADGVAQKVGIDTVYADCLPADKIKALESLRSRQQSVAFVGDGVNDAPVLTAADVGIALGARGSTAASEAADVVILLDDLSKVAVSREIATRTFKIARQSILIGIGMSFALMAMFSTGKFKPSLGAALQEIVDVSVIINALRAHRGNLRYAGLTKLKK
jgi:heavy metal translocating P-type ATPase